MVTGHELGHSLHNAYVFARQMYRRNAGLQLEDWQKKYISTDPNPNRKQEIHSLLGRAQEVVKYFTQTESEPLSLTVAEERFFTFMDLSMHPQVKRMMQEVGERMQSFFTGPFEGGNFIVKKSGASMGMLARLVSGWEHTKGTQDIDVVFFHNTAGRVSNDAYTKLTDRFAEVLANPQNSELPNDHFHPCEFLFAPWGQHLDNFSPQTIVKQLRSITVWQEAHPFTDGLFPSFPKSHNHEIIISGLQQLAKDDPKEWERVVSLVEDRWNVEDSLNPKYFTDDYIFTFSEHENLKAKYEEMSGEFEKVRNSVFSDMIRATGNPA